MRRCLRPAGERIRLRGGPAGDGAEALGEPDIAVRFYDSGTAALAAALTACVAARPVSKPELLLPAYACPDLVSAAVFAGVRPRLVDLTRERPWMSLDGVRAAITPNTVAVIAVNFLGIDERVDALMDVTAAANIPLIYDCAQSLEAGIAAADVPLRVASFGRGKPVSLLGGGAVLCSDVRYLERLPSPPEPARGRFRHAAFIAAATAYNLMSRPRLYAFPASLPFLKLGETRYAELDHLGAMPQYKQALIAANMAGQTAAHEVVTDRIRDALRSGTSGSVVDLPAVCGATRGQRLLRYPLLMPTGESRDRAVRRLRSLGVSDMYRTTLPAVPGVGPRVLASRHPHAEDFARRLLTLPVHGDVRPPDVTTIVEAIAMEAKAQAEAA
jgi:dTDP-4-amino-4,6-dideoxygalactose transaminase